MLMLFLSLYNNQLAIISHRWGKLHIKYHNTSIDLLYRKTTQSIILYKEIPQLSKLTHTCTCQYCFTSHLYIQIYDKKTNQQRKSVHKKNLYSNIQITFKDSKVMGPAATHPWRKGVSVLQYTLYPLVGSDSLLSTLLSEVSSPISIFPSPSYFHSFLLTLLQRPVSKSKSHNSASDHPSLL